jgi:hypothetical protein
LLAGLRGNDLELDDVLKNADILLQEAVMPVSDQLKLLTNTGTFPHATTSLMFFDSIPPG